MPPGAIEVALKVLDQGFMLVAIIGAIKGWWVPGHVFQAQKKELEETRCILFQVLHITEKVTR